MWKLERDRLVMNEIEDVTVLARIGAQRVIQQLGTICMVLTVQIYHLLVYFVIINSDIFYF